MAVTPDWHMSKAGVYLRGSRISDTIEKKPGVPENANTRLETAVIPSVNDGLPTILKSECQGVSV